ncbi:hypothetical protein [Lactiplantibacillus daowaiensis]|uniref:Morphogenesis protein n=1 Tax=Lactiplantibacillus daowaiensis TaxID=2559918 RepID=A0ABW1RXZ4_9LACO|nr:hypothetical protein [Lactiplantibacillus daowaiensis]
MTEINPMPRIIRELEQLQSARIVVGVPRSDNQLTMIALVQEYGKTIRPVHGDWLVIPTSNARKMGVTHASQVPGMFRPKGKNILAMKDEGAENGLKVMFILRKEVRIPARPFLRLTYEQNLQLWGHYAAILVSKMIAGDLSATEVQTLLAKRIVTNMKSTIRYFSKPGNAPLTTEAKGFNDPLIDSQKLLNSITYFLEGEI